MSSFAPRKSALSRSERRHYSRPGVSAMRDHFCPRILATLALLSAAAAPPIRVDADGNELPRHALARLGSLRFYSGGRVTSLAFSPDGKMLVSGSQSSHLTLWDARQGVIRRQCPLAGSPCFVLGGTAL